MRNLSILFLSLAFAALLFAVNPYVGTAWVCLMAIKAISR